MTLTAIPITLLVLALAFRALATAAGRPFESLAHRLLFVIVPLAALSVVAGAAHLMAEL